MGIINPFMLIFSLCGLLIALMYFIKNKYVDHIVPSTRLWEDVLNEESTVTKFEKFKNRLIMYLQLLILLLLVLMLAGLYINSKDQVNGNTLIFIDNSIMMGYSESEKTNLEIAKKEAIEIVNKSSDSATFTILDALGKSSFSSNREDAKKNIDNIYQLNTNLKLSLANNVISAFRSSNEDAYVLVFSNYSDVSGDRTYRYPSMKENVAITNIDVFKGNYNVEITNYYSGEKQIELLLKLDNETIEVFSIKLNPSDNYILSGKFSQSGQTISAKINTKDDIEIDNYASKTVEVEKNISVFLSDSSSSYVRDALILNKNLIISESVDSEILNEGFDIYVYDGVEPEKLPKTGSMLLLNPPKSSKFVSGAIQKEMYIKLSNDDANSFVEPFYVGLSKELNAKTLKTIGTVDGKSIIQKGMIGELSTVVMGFDILDTNLPLKYSFPVYIQNIMQYFTNDTDEDEVYILADKIIDMSGFTDKEEMYVTREGDTNLIINLKWIIALLVFALLVAEMEVFKREY